LLNHLKLVLYVHFSFNDLTSYGILILLGPKKLVPLGLRLRFQPVGLTGRRVEPTPRRARSEIDGSALEFCVLCLKSQIPSTKLQINLKLQITNSKQGPKPFFLFFCLLFRISVIGIYLLFVICVLLFGISPFGHAQRRCSRGASAYAARAPRVVIYLFFGICYLEFQ